jgi:hypothetical protein
VGVFVGASSFSLEAFAADDDGDEQLVVPGQPAVAPSGAAPQQVIVIVQPQQPQQGLAPSVAKRRAPRVGDPPEEIDAYLAELKDDLREKQRAFRDARRGSDDGAREAARDDMDDANRLYKDERSRLTTQDGGLIAGGATLTAAGGASFVASAVLAIVWALGETSVVFGGHNSYSAEGYASLACLAGGFLGVGAGIPMIVIGVQRVPREPGEASLGPLPVGFAPPPVGLTAGWTF